MKILTLALGYNLYTPYSVRPDLKILERQACVRLTIVGSLSARPPPPPSRVERVGLTRIVCSRAIATWPRPYVAWTGARNQCRSEAFLPPSEGGSGWNIKSSLSLMKYWSTLPRKQGRKAYRRAS